MNFSKFADLMSRVGFRDGERVASTFVLSKADLKSSVFAKHAYTKVVGHYYVVSMWEQEGEVALWAQERGSGTKLFPFHKKEVDYLAKKNKFRKN